jgi:hypothetical protein
MSPDIHVAIKSYKRAGEVTTLNVVPFGWLWVPESQAEDYRREYGERVIAIPDVEDGNLCRKQNAILNRTPSPWVVILDDDITAIGRWEGGGHHRLKPDEIMRLIEDGFSLAAQMGVTLWGIQQRQDGLCYDVYQPFSLLSPILGPFHGHLSPTVRYDERALGKDDYDFWLQTIAREHKTLRLEKYHYLHDHGHKQGGFVAQRTLAIEMRGVAFMREKWGSYYRCGGAKGAGATGKNILNSRISIPLRGV